MSGGGGGNAQETLGSWSPIMTGYWAGPEGRPEQGFLERVNNESRKPYEAYQGNRVAGLNPFQTGAGNAIYGYALNGSALGNAGREQARATVAGDYLNSNPYAGTQGIGYNEMTVNPGMNHMQSQVGSNEFMGENPYFASSLQRGQDSIIDSYNKGTNANVRRMANMSGAFGGSAHQAMQADADRNLGNTLQQFTQNAMQQQYDRSANLREADIARRQGSSEFNAGIGENNINRNLQGQMFNSQLGDRNVDRYNTGRNSGMQAWENERNRMTGMAPAAMGNDASVIGNIQSALGYGNQLQGQSQKELDDAYSRWSEGQNWTRGNLGWLANMLAQAQGSTGSTTSFGGYGGINPIAGLLGAGSLASAFMGGGK